MARTLLELGATWCQERVVVPTWPQEWPKSVLGNRIPRGSHLNLAFRKPNLHEPWLNLASRRAGIRAKKVRIRCGNEVTGRWKL